jgi:acetylornithine deacetylase
MPLQNDLKAKIISSVARGFEEQVRYTQDLIRLRSVRGDEHVIQDRVFRIAGSRLRDGPDQESIEKHPGGSPVSDQHSRAPIVVGIHRPRQESGRSLILQAHVDVVPEGPISLWTHPPYDPVIEGDWLYGRGGADMKAGHAANLYALDTGNGALMTHLRGYKADAVLIPEPEDEKLVRANVGVVWFQVEVRGVPVHVREMGAGANAIDAAYRVIGELRRLESEWNERKRGRPHFEDEEHPINLNIGKIEGGDWASSVPAWCRIDCRISIYPGWNAEDASREIRERIAKYSLSDKFLSNIPPVVTFNGFQTEGYVLDPGSDAERILGDSHLTATGKPLQSFMTAGYLDTRVYALYDKIPALCYGPYSENIHGFDERVSLASLKRITSTMALFVADWCGLEPIEAKNTSDFHKI